MWQNKLLFVIFAVLLVGSVIGFESRFSSEISWFNGSVGIGTETPTVALDVVGSVKVAGVGTGNVPHSCQNRRFAFGGPNLIANCLAGEIATGGGVSCGSGNVRQSIPNPTVGTPTGWNVVCTVGGVNTLDVVCCKI